jgi:hypothetical protein
MRRSIGGALLVIAGLGLSLLTGPVSAVAPTSLRDVVSGSTNEETFLPSCSDAGAMECIEALEFKLGGRWQSAPGPFIVKTVVSDDDNGNIIYGRDLTYFDTPGLLHAEGVSQIAAFVVVSPYINGPEYPAYKVDLQAVEVRNDRYRNVDPARLDQTSYRLTFRTANLRPIFSQLTTVDAETSVSPVPGGLRVSVSGEPGPSQFAGDNDQTDTALAITYGWFGFITDARARGGVLTECQGLGIVTAYSNGYGGQMPEWDGKTGTLSFGTSGFHYAPDGSVYKGRAEVFVPGPLARCMWKVDPRQTARMEIEVYAENGEEAAGTKSISYDAKADLVKMIASDFTFSEKQIAARPSPIEAEVGKKVCDAAKSMCVTVDRSRKTARVALTKVMRANEVTAIALAGTREQSATQVRTRVTKGKASLTLKLSGPQAKGQVWVVRTPSTFISSFRVG